MKRKAVVIGGAGLLLGALVLGGGAVAAAGANGDGGEDETETAITGTALADASAAALAFTGEGSVTGTEVGDEESYYEVEVTLDNGTEVDVQLDADFAVVGSESDTGSEAGDGAD
jgi:uncharacterized membrane protein YkoI